MPRLFTMPEVATGSERSTISAWVLPEGDTFAGDDVVATVETDKAMVEISADAPGVLVRQLVPAGVEVDVGTPIALLAEVGETVEDVTATLAELGVAPDGAGSDAPRGDAPQDAGPPPPPAADRSPGQRIFVSPLARRMADEAGLDLADIPGSGPRGRIRKADVLAAIASRPAAAPPAAAPPAGEPPAASPQPAAPGQDRPGDGIALEQPDQTPHSRIRRTIARRLVESKQTVPHFYLRGSARVDSLLALRTELNAAGATSRISVNDLVVKAVARALMQVPEMNVTWGESAVTRYSTADIAVAVSTDDGLVTPVVRGVERMPISELSATIKDLAERATRGGLRQDELEGGSFTVSNLGMFGTEEFIGIINPPHAGLLAVGAARPEPVVGADGDLGSAMVLRTTLSADHRPVDGVTGARWMQALVTLLESPLQILL